MSNPLLTVAIIAACVAIGAAIGNIVVSRYFDRRRRIEREQYPNLFGAPAPKKIEKLDMFCGDCGKGLVSLRSQDGFNTKTGEPVYSYTRACAKASMTGSHYNDFPYCGVRTQQTYLPNAHNHPDPDAASLTCPVCLDVMMDNAGIDPKQALELYAKTGVQSQTPMREYDRASLSSYFLNKP